MRVTRPNGLRPDESLPAQLRDPRDAYNYVGRKVCSFTSADISGEPASWHIGVVKSIDFDGAIPYLKIVYLDEESDEMWWEEMWWEDFRQWAVVEDDTRMPGQQERRRGHGTAGSAAEATHGPGPGSGETAGSSQPRKRKAAAIPSTKAAKPADGGQAAHRRGHQGQGAVSDDADADEQQQGDEGGQGADPRNLPAVRRRLNLEPYEETQHQHQNQNHDNQGHQPQSRRQQHHQHHAADTRPAHRRTPGEEAPAPAGHLHRIQLINFMCHDNLEVKFNQYVTFVTGRNGSGKSALLQGLQACLGASARDTGRGSSLGNWVNRERHTATVTLEIWNTTEQEVPAQKWPPYRHELFGSMIRIVRKIVAREPATETTLNRAGAATYQLFAANGTEVKPTALGRSAAREVEQLADHFNIDASNPLIVITQEMAQKFHQVTQGSGACKKYDMFMAGTCLARTRDMLAAAQINVVGAAANLQKHAEEVRAKREKVKELETKLRSLEQADVYKQQLADLEVASVWAIVEEARAGLGEAKDAAAGYPAQVAELQERVKEHEDAMAKLQTQEAGLRDEMENTRTGELPARMQQLSNRRKAAMKRSQDAARRLEAAVAAARDLADRRASLETALAQLEREQQSEGLLARVREHGEQVAAKQAELTELTATANQLKADHQVATAKHAEAEDAVAAAALEADQARAAAREAREAHQELLSAAAGGNSAQRQAVDARNWGRDNMALAQAVAAVPLRTFSAPPIGPLGLYVRRRAGCDDGNGDGRRARALDLALGGCLRLWVVARREDSDALRQLATSLRMPRPDIAVVQYREQPLAYGSAPVVDARGRTWLRPIDLVEPVEGLSPLMRGTVLNVLLDQGKAASVALVQSREEGQEVAEGRNPVLVTRGLRRAYDAAGCLYTAVGAGNFTTDFFHLPATCRLAADKRAQLSESERAVAERAAELEQVEAALREARAAEAASQREVRAVRERQLALARDQRQRQCRLDQLLEAAPAAESKAQSADVLNKLHATQRDLAAAAASQTRLEEERNNAAAETDAIITEVEKLQRRSSQYMCRRQELVAQLDTLAQRKQDTAAALAVTREALKAARGDLQQAQQQIDLFEYNLKQAEAQAQQICPRSEGLEALERLRASRSAEVAEKLANRSQAHRDEAVAQTMKAAGLQRWTRLVSQKIEAAERSAGGNLGELRVRLAAARAELGRDRAACEAVAKKVAVMQEAQQLRKIHYERLRQQVEHVSNAKFGRYMQRRNITATLQLDHGAERLDLRVRKNNEAEQATSLMQLSGGERSFTTSAFLLALGEVLDTPFRAMDEYDVYMDPTARKLATIALLEYAWTVNPDSQMILLSPQDTATLTEAFQSLKRNCEKDGEAAPPKDFVRIVQLKPPRGDPR